MDKTGAHDKRIKCGYVDHGLHAVTFSNHKQNVNVMTIYQMPHYSNSRRPCKKNTQKESDAK